MVSSLHVNFCYSVGMMGMMPMMRPPGMMPPPAGIAMPPFRPPSSQVTQVLLFLKSYMMCQKSLVCFKALYLFPFLVQ